jgi:hypothetical protein
MLEKRGYNEAYIKLSKRINIKRNIGIALIVPALGALAAFVVWLVFGSLSEPKHLLYAYTLWFLLIIPFPILEMKKGGKEFKELAVKSNTDIVIDFKYRILHLVFIPSVEIIFAFIYIVYFIVFIEVFHVAFIHILILWFLYGTARFSKNLTRPNIRDSYIFNYIFMVLNQLILIFHVIREAFMRYGCDDCIWDADFVLGIVLGAALICKLIYSFFKFPEFNSRLKYRSK